VVAPISPPGIPQRAVANVLCTINEIGVLVNDLFDLEGGGEVHRERRKAGEGGEATHCIEKQI